jgi:hypothetical protein
MYLLQGMLDSSVLPTVSQWDSYVELLFIQVAAAPHFVLSAFALFGDRFPGWIGCFRTN